MAGRRAFVGYADKAVIARKCEFIDSTFSLDLTNQFRPSKIGHMLRPTKPGFLPVGQGGTVGRLA